MLYMVLLSLLIGAAVYLVTYGLGTLALNKIYMSPESIAARQAEIYADFSGYVNSRHVSGSDENAVTNWPGNNAYTTILIYRDEDLPQSVNVRPGASPAYGSSNASRLQYTSEYGRLYPMRFADGVYHISIGDSSQVREDTVNRIIAVVLGSGAFLAVMLWFIRRLTRRVIRLSREADAIGDGDLEAPITLQGEDELSQLAQEVDAMRHSVIARMSGERKAWETNAELITAISHDIRTPMTALIGYLGLLCGGAEDEATRAQLASSAYVKAMELKDLTDQLFRYFLVYGKAELDLSLERMDARLLLEQLLGEMEFDLADAGYTMRRADFEGECTITVDPLFLKRVLDNLQSNIRKYADPDKPVEAVSALGGGRLTLRVSNGVAELRTRKDSTKIGLRTCEKIMTALGGSFHVENDGETFTAELTLPAEMA